ncbi:MAG: hypothetical protein MUE61_10795, partial [Vicinamibacterales bacterium]|nr:hypothetical protein [Vicinamibacterales bacterium]
MLARSDARHLEQLVLPVDVVDHDLRDERVPAGVAPHVEDERLRAAFLHLDDQFAELAGRRRRPGQHGADGVALLGVLEVAAHVREAHVGNLLAAIRRREEGTAEAAADWLRQRHARRE